MSTLYWLAKLSPQGFATALIDGPHDTEAGAHEAAGIMIALGLRSDAADLCVAKVTQSAVQPSSRGVDEEAVATLRPLIVGRKATDQP